MTIAAQWGGGAFGCVSECDELGCKLPSKEAKKTAKMQAKMPSQGEWVRWSRFISRA